MLNETALSFVFTLLVWWLGTGIVMLLCALPRRTFRWSFAGGTLALAAGLWGIAATAHATDAAGAYLAFLSAVAVWGWLEMSFLMGFVTGPRLAPCPPEATGWRRFRLAVATLLYHELSIFAAGLVILALTWGTPNQTGMLAFLILMVMRISAKLNIFLGVPNLTDAFLPARLAYLKSYFRKSEASVLFPLSVFGGSLAAIGLAHRAFGASGQEPVGCALLFALISLAILEHLFMVTPLPDAALWRWAMPSRDRMGGEGRCKELDATIERVSIGRL